MLHHRIQPRSGRALLALALGCTSLLTGVPALASDGYWRFTGYTIDPPQADLVAGDKAETDRGRVSERRVSGGYQAADSGAGGLELFFKADDADRRVYITTMSFGFTTGTEMRSLRAGQTVKVNSTLSLGGNDLAKALPASGTGTVWVNNGNYVINLAVPIGQQVSGSGSFTVPGGTGKDDTLTIHGQAHIGAYGALNGTLSANYVWVPEAAPPPVKPPVTPAARPGGPRQWMTGSFDSTEGPVQLTPAGGTYSQDGGRIRVSRIRGATMEGYWEEQHSDRQCRNGRYYGRIRWTFTPEGFTGTWGYCDEAPTRAWSGKRQ